MKKFGAITAITLLVLIGLAGPCTVWLLWHYFLQYLPFDEKGVGRVALCLPLFCAGIASGVLPVTFAVWLAIDLGDDM